MRIYNARDKRTTTFQIQCTMKSVLWYKYEANSATPNVKKYGLGQGDYLLSLKHSKP